MFIHTKKTSFKVEDKEDILNKCLQFHCYFHQNYKLPDVNKQYLSTINNFFGKKEHLDNNYFEIETLETLAVQHSIEVDFQKTGETTDFKLKCNYPDYLTKKHLRTRMNFLSKIKELYDIYNGTIDWFTEMDEKNKKCKANDYQFFYDFFNKRIETEKCDFNRKYLRLYKKTN